MFEKDLSLNLLFDTYGELLPENQRDMFEQYYCDDLSLSEIAENAGITRQGVRDRIDKARRALTMYEEKLGFVKKLSELEAARRKAAEKLSALTEKEAKEALDVSRKYLIPFLELLDHLNLTARQEEQRYWTSGDMK